MPVRQWARRLRYLPPIAFLRGYQKGLNQKWIHGADGTVVPIGLKALRQ